jgi:hypothetical protein
MPVAPAAEANSAALLSLKLPAVLLLITYLTPCDVVPGPPLCLPTIAGLSPVRS